jgi:hypothetical protein
MNAASIVARITFAAAIAVSALLGGCKVLNKDKDAGAMAERLNNAPPVRIETLGDNHMLIMQAPNPGWSYRLDRDERDRDGWVVYITIRKPDPAFMYPQRIVDKRLLTEVESDEPIRVVARLLEHGEKGTGDQYAPLKLTDLSSP